MAAPPVIVITGSVGAGKSTTSTAYCDLLNERGKRVWLVDMDYLRSVYPHPEGDRFGSALGFRNLKDMWPNVAATGVDVIVIADVVESMDKRARYQAAIPGADVTIVRLDVSVPVMLERLEKRENAHSIAWFRERAAELQEILTRNGVGDIVIQVGRDQTPDQVARALDNAIIN